MARLLDCLAFAVLGVTLLTSGCGQPAAPPAPTKPAEPTKAAAPTKAAEPTKAPVPQPTAAPAKKVDFPAKGRTITIIVPWSAGGDADISSRVVAAFMEKDLGVPVQVVNKPGAGTQLGLEEIARAKPDGYTLGATNLPVTTLTYVDPERKATYNRQSFVPVANVGQATGGIGVKADSPIKTLKDLVDAAKAKPGELKMATTGLMTHTHIHAVMLEQAAGVKFALVHFDGGAPATTALLGGHVDASCQSMAAYGGNIQSGAVRIVATLGKERGKLTQQFPTAVEQGFQVVGYSTRGLSAPAGTPKEIVDILSGSIKKAMQNPDVLKRFEDILLEPDYMDAARFAAFWAETEPQDRKFGELALQK